MGRRGYSQNACVELYLLCWQHGKIGSISGKIDPILSEAECANPALLSQLRNGWSCGKRNGHDYKSLLQFQHCLKTTEWRDLMTRAFYEFFVNGEEITSIIGNIYFWSMKCNITFHTKAVGSVLILLRVVVSSLWWKVGSCSGHEIRLRWSKPHSIDNICSNVRDPQHLFLFGSVAWIAVRFLWHAIHAHGLHCSTHNVRLCCKLST